MDETNTSQASIKEYTQLKPFLDWQLILLGLMILSLVNLNQLQSWTQAANFSLYDKQLQVLPVVADKEILIVEIDEESLSLLGDWPWPRSYHGQMIEMLTRADAAVIAYNVVFSSFNEKDKNDVFLTQSIEGSGRTILPLYFDRLLKSRGVSEVLPADSFRQFASLGHVNSYLDSDGKLRTIRLRDQISDHHWLHFSLASFLFSQPHVLTYNQIKEDVYIPFVTKGDFERVSFVDVLTGLVPLTTLSQRTVFVGVTATSMGDPLLTPVDDKGRQSPAVDINANIYQALKNDSLIHPLSIFACIFINSLMVFMALYLIPRLSGMQQLIMTAISVIAVWFISYGLLMLGVWYPSAGLMMALLVLPFIWNLLRLSRLFNYLRFQLKQLQQQSSKIFRLPEFIQLNNEDDLKSILSLMQIDNFQLMARSEIKLDSMLLIVKSLIVTIGRREKLLVLYFDEFTSLEKRKLSLLNQLLSSSSYLSVGAQNQIRSDMFSQQLSVLDAYQQQVAMSHSLFDASIEGLAAGIIVTDLAGAVLFSNQGVADLIEHEISKLAELFVVVKLIQGDWVEILREAILLQQPMKVEAKVELMNKSIDLSISIRCIESQEGLAPLLVFNLIDISEIKQAHRSRNEMIDFLSHDLRSPMASLQALVYQARSPSAQGSLTQAEIIDKVDQYSQRGLDFAEQFLSLAKVENEEVIELYEIDLYSVSQNALDSLYHQAQEKSIQLSLSVVDDCWVMANGDLLERIILNLVSNAIKYSPSGSEVVLSIVESEANATRFLEVCIADQGPGIPAELMARLFKPYQRGGDSNTQQAQGIGLGLRFVDVALKRLKSQIQFKSSSDGASFYFILEAIEV
jgi:CHASE2 domain-containing sensor protein/signal transduction histidine kinase